MIDKVISSAPGKVIITGEHSVVHGETALLAALGLRAKAEVQKLDKPVVHFSSEAINGTYEGSIKNIINMWNRAKLAWKEFYQEGQQDELVLLRNEPFLVMVCSAGLVLHELDSHDVGFEVKVESELPMISGFGSSAYTAASVIGALGCWLGKRYGKRALFNRVYEVEKIMHGNPSGGDPAIVIQGGFLKFQKHKERYESQPLEINPSLFKNLVLLNSGKAVETTGELVVGVVGAKIKRNPKKYKKIIRNMGKVSAEFIDELNDGCFRAELLYENERRLEELGVVGEKAKGMIRKVESIGGTAKVSGGGGIKAGSGLMLAYHDDKEKLDRLIRKEGWQSFATSLGGEGWKIE
jgi:mevalonate kinase